MSNSSDDGAWGVLKAFLKADPQGRAGLTLEGGAEMEAPFERLFGPTGALRQGLPGVEDFQICGDRELMSVLGPGWSVYEADPAKRAGQIPIVLAWRREKGGEFRRAGRLLVESAEDELRNFASQQGDPDSRWEFLARLRPRLGMEQEILPDPAAAYAEVFAPTSDTPVGVVLLPVGDPLIPFLSTDMTVAVTVLLGRPETPGGVLKLLSPPQLGWPGGLTDGRTVSGQDAASRNPESPALEVARAFLAAKPEGRLDYVNSQDNAMLIKELEGAYDDAPPAESAIGQILAQPATTARAGAVAVRVHAPTHDRQGACVLWLVPFVDTYKVEGQLWAQSFYGWFRNYLKSPVSIPRELRGLVFSTAQTPDGPWNFRFRDVHSDVSVELVLPENAEQVSSLAKLRPGEGRPATLRLRWEIGESPRIMLDEWICWGYRGIDEQAY
ncbi:MAG: hypothetical protein ACKO2G_13705 [Verrucomicrobiales bacterium]